MEARGLVKRKNGNIVPQPILKLFNLPIRDIILRYRTMLNGVLNYYTFVNNRPQLLKIHWILRVSLAKTLAAKLKLGRVYKVYNRFTKDIAYRIVKKNGKVVVLDFKCPPLPKNLMDFQGTSVYKNPLSVLDWKYETINSFNFVCANCAAEQDVEMHHVKHLKTLNVNLSPFDKMLASINRKQVPLCHSCHVSVHKGEYMGMSLKHYNVEKWQGEAK